MYSIYYIYSIYSIYASPGYQAVPGSGQACQGCTGWAGSRQQYNNTGPDTLLIIMGCDNIQYLNYRDSSTYIFYVNLD